MSEYSINITSNNPAPRVGPKIGIGDTKPIAVAGYEKNLHITPDGIVEQGGGKVYYENKGGDFIEVVMTDSRDVIQNVVRTKKASRTDIETIGRGIPITPGPTNITGEPT